MTAYTPPTTAEKLRSLPWSLAANAGNAIFAQLVFFGPAYVLFLNELNISRSDIGFLLSLVPFTGLVALFIAPRVARFGYKRTFILFWGTRKVISVFLLVVPFVAANFGVQAAVLLITLIMSGFSLCRAIAETGYYPWVREFVPDSVRGKYSATNSALSNLISIMATIFATVVIGLSTDINRFMILFAIGLLGGFWAVAMYTRIPGGAAINDEEQQVTLSPQDVINTLKDRNLRFYLGGLMLFTFGTGPLYSFLPLFMRQEVGLSESNTLSLQVSILIGGLLLSQLLGWSADRYGSRPVMFTGITLVMLLPFGWLMIPRMAETSFLFALMLAFFQGVASISWLVGSSRLLFTRVIPEENKSQYMAVYYAGLGLIGGLSQFIGGRLLDLFGDVSGQFLFITIDSFSVLMVMGIILPALSLLFFRNVVSDSRVSTVEFASMFLHGNPVFALGTMMRFYRARDESEAVRLTEQMGQTNSPLTVEEMVSALADPRFYVRFEAVISIARMDKNPQLTQALIELLNGTEISLSVMAAWALGRLGDESAIPALRDGLDSEYKSIRAHCARALGSIGDHQAIPLLHDRIKETDDAGLQIAYASTLANLNATSTISTLFDILDQTSNKKARMEITLSMARMISDENHFVTLVRGYYSDAGTTLSQEMMRLRGRLNKSATARDELVTLCSRATEAFGNDRLTQGFEYLTVIVESCLFLTLEPTAQKLLQGSLEGLQKWGVEHPEYGLLALNILNEEQLFSI